MKSEVTQGNIHKNGDDRVGNRLTNIPTNLNRAALNSKKLFDIKDLFRTSEKSLGFEKPIYSNV